MCVSQPNPNNLSPIGLTEESDVVSIFGNLSSLHFLQNVLFLTNMKPSITRKTSSFFSMILPQLLQLPFQTAFPEYSFTIVSQLIIHDSQIKTLLKGDAS